ncbi:serine carboxypeptidase S28-domain-containing protein [Stachybotrys elegans]|uniref:Serine carboxypeptidase S28-domain-containing protein n=1 Tax=Stachybotrys elegans TaxID=80388 RepID=A0A8K0WKT8_9HYPO|nr:serine carboxypeptidase S28-domain-containing protein [Stachybotrys elegans]
MLFCKAAAGLLALATSASALQALPIPQAQLKRQTQLQRQSRLTAAATYQEYNLTVPIDHFHNDTKYEPHSNGTFNLRYWFDAQFYKPGGPVFVLSAGETNGENRFPFMEKGIIYEIAKATGGIGVILEHRYYGTSIPVPSFSTENLRFLTTEQALEDTAYFAKNVVFEGFEDVDWSPDVTPWIVYGGSYAGAFVAFLRVVYPDIFFAAISSSGVPQAIWDYWEYFDGARLFGPEVCSETTGKLTHIVDTILLNETLSEYVGPLKDVYGLGYVSSDTDFAAALRGGIYDLQSYNWDPEISGDSFFEYCDLVSNNTNQFPELEEKRSAVEELITVAGYGDEVDPLADRMLNYIGSLGYALRRCGGTADECFGFGDREFYAQDDTSETWRLWPYQVCTEWGYLQTGSGAPDDVLPMISRLVDLEYSSQICRETFGMTGVANVSNINKYGGFDIAYDRLMFLDGEWDPWRAAGVQAVTQEPRESTPRQPVVLIDDAVHHWDENGVFPNETRPGIPPQAVVDAKAAIEEFVLEMLKEWEPARK